MFCKIVSPLPFEYLSFAAFIVFFGDHCFTIYHLHHDRNCHTISREITTSFEICVVVPWPDSGFCIVDFVGCF